jgi:transposase
MIALSYSKKRLANLLGLSYQKAKFISSRLDEKAYDEKREEWVTKQLLAILKKAKEKEAVVLFGYEVSLALWGSLGRTWALLIEDGAAYHGSKVVKDFLAQETHQLTVERLPAFSPDYNPIEKLWKNTKRDATHLKYFEQFDDLRHAVLDTFKSYLDDACKVLCVMTKMRQEFCLTD